MNNFVENQWLQYLETPRATTSPVKLDQIMAKRLAAFIKARKVKPYRSKKKK